MDREGISSNSSTRILSKKGEGCGYRFNNWLWSAATLPKTPQIFMAVEVWQLQLQVEVCLILRIFSFPRPKQFPRQNIKTFFLSGTQYCSHTQLFSRSSRIYTPTHSHPAPLQQKVQHEGQRETPSWLCVPSHICTSPWTSQNLTFPPHKVGRRPNILPLGFWSSVVVGDEGKAIRKGPDPSLISTASAMTRAGTLFSPAFIQLLWLWRPHFPTCFFLQPAHTKEKSMESKSSPPKTEELFMKRKIFLI